MTDNSSKEYQYLNISGPISVTPVVPGTLPRGSVVLILGPTGAGKSTFIEALSPDSSLQISSNQLEGFTQSIGTYRIENVKDVTDDGSTQPIYLVGVPGFADTKISETSIVSMLRDWMKVSPTGYLGQILYLTPIQSARMPGSHRQVLRTVQAMTGQRSAANITIVTTMWDRLWSETSKMRAESNFNELRDVIWKDFMDEGGQIVKFYNTQDSVLSILNTLLPAFSYQQFVLEEDSDEKLKDTPFGKDLQENLRSRIRNIDIERANLQDDLKSPSTQSNETLKSTLATQLEEVERLLTKFTKELHDNFGPDDDGVESSSIQVKINHAITSPGPGLVPSRQDVIPSMISRPEISAEAVPETGKVVRVIRALKCWGADATRQYDD
ncbi:hypothetical protein BJ165DRAFT_1533252 [Panaeolus papilionaceus]|nr:hypothetical protein BJ165DRAFT_1533252 [Panaeolus papilionaceus]